MGVEMSHHLGYKAGQDKPEGESNERNGASGKTVLTDKGAVRIEVPRDRAGSFEPILIPKHERRFTGFDDKIIAMYARGMSVREIQGFIAEQYGTEVSPDFISSVTDEVMAEVRLGRPPAGADVSGGVLRCAAGQDPRGRRRAQQGDVPGAGHPGRRPRDMLGLWIEQTEGAKFWLKVFNDLKTRGVNDILIAVVDGLKGMAEAINTVYPKTTVQTCIVHLIRNSLDYAGWKDRKPWPRPCGRSTRP